MKLNPRLAESYYVLGHARLGKNEYEAAIAAFDQAVQLKPQMASALHGRGTARMKIGQFDRPSQISIARSSSTRTFRTPI
jgi:cytochrome c-type biogenesis protein CcmH/NrfG